MLGVRINFSRCLPSAARLPGGRNRPPYNTRQTAGETGNFAFAADVSFPGTHLRGIVGRAFTPAAVTSGCPAFPVQCPLCSAKLPAIAAFPGRCLASSRKAAGYRNAWGAHSPFPPPSVCRHVARRAKSPALQYKANGRRNRERNARGSVHFPGSHLRGIVGRAFTPAAVTSGCPGLPGPMPALPCKVSRNRGVSGPMKIIGPYANGAAIRKASGWCYTARRPIFEHAKHADHQNFSSLIPDF